MFGKKISNVFLFLFFICFVLCGRVYSEQIYMPLLTVFQDSPEGDNVMALDIKSFIEAELPIITTVCPLYEHFNFFEKDLKNKDKWLVYLNKDETFVLLLPKSFVFKVKPKGKSVFEILGLDRKYLRLVTFIEMDKVFSDDKYKNISIEMSHFDKFFIKKREEEIDTSIAAKMIIATGHGFSALNQVVGIKFEQYKDFLKILNTINTQFLMVDSCYTGGENLLKMHELVSTDMPGKLLSELSYPIVIRATTIEGVVSSTIVSVASLVLSKFFQRIEELIENRQFYFGVPITQIEGRIVKKTGVFSIRQALLTYEFLTLHHATALPSIHMPGTSFFRVIDVDHLLILTYVSLQQFKIAEKVRISLEEKKKLMPKVKASEEGTAKIDEKEWIQKVKNLPSPVLHISSDVIKRVMIYPSVIKDITLEIDDSFVPFTSHIHGDGQHFIEKLKAPNLNFSESLSVFLAPLEVFQNPGEQEVRLYGKSKVGWLIDELETKDFFGDDKIKGLVVKRDIYNSIIAFRLADGSYKALYFDLEQPKLLAISDFETIDKEKYEIIVQNIYNATKTANEALREASGGNEDRASVDHAYKDFAKKMEISESTSGEEFSREFVPQMILSKLKLTADVYFKYRRIKKGKDINSYENLDEAKKMAISWIGSKNLEIKEYALLLWKDLSYSFKIRIVEWLKSENYSALTKALNIAIDGIKINNSEALIDALDLWEELFKNGIGFAEAEKIDNPQLRKLLNKYKPKEKGEEPKTVETLPVTKEAQVEAGEPVPAV